jgi:5-methyltetrahydropteroyltriglutamate--homocysteine methyltransferase
MAIAANLGYPRIGRRRELKRALEAYWSGRLDAEALHSVAREVRREAWLTQRAVGIETIPSNDFSFYDHMLDTAVSVGAVPERYRSEDALTTYFAMARGEQQTQRNLAALEMTKWFDTNYHYIVPELPVGFLAHAAPQKLLTEFAEARSLGLQPRPVLVGPITFLLLAKHAETGNPFAALDTLASAYAELLRHLADAGVEEVQLDEPCLVTDLNDHALAAYARAYRTLADAAPGLRLLLATYFGTLTERRLATVLALPIHALHLDLVRDPRPIASILDQLPENISLSLGIVDGRNVWRNNLETSLTTIERITEKIGSERVIIAPSCSLLHVPHDLDEETELDPEIRPWLAFGKEKLREVRTLTDGVNHGRSRIASALDESREILSSRQHSPRVHHASVAERLREVTPQHLARKHNFETRQAVQQERLNLPIFPTTTIGSFPQTSETRKARADFRTGRIDSEAYHSFLRHEIERTVRFQEEIGLDVLVHGEPERNDMVEYFGEMLTGFVFTRHGWIQSYGSRCVKPPIIFGDVARRHPMTVEWSGFAQSLTKKPLKGMLTGPVTILQWSFVRDDQARKLTAMQIAIAIRDEVADLEAAGIPVIQIDEPALREGLPLRADERAEYLRWAIDAFRLASAVAKDTTQVHTHMCYADFNEILEAIVELDADVISIEASRSNFTLLEGLAKQKYPNHIGPGVYDIHSPRVPSETEIVTFLERVIEHVPADRVWVNPDCGLKTRDWPETEAALRAMVAAARKMRSLMAVH